MIPWLSFENARHLDDVGSPDLGKLGIHDVFASPQNACANGLRQHQNHSWPHVAGKVVPAVTCLIIPTTSINKSTSRASFDRKSCHQVGQAYQPSTHLGVSITRISKMVGVQWKKKTIQMDDLGLPLSKQFDLRKDSDLPWAPPWQQATIIFQLLGQSLQKTPWIMAYL